jgi:hypothetical protein
LTLTVKLVLLKTGLSTRLTVTTKTIPASSRVRIDAEISKLLVRSSLFVVSRMLLVLPELS